MSNNSQLVKKEDSGYKEVYPLSYIQNIIDAETKEKLSDILIRYNHIYVPWQNSVTDTRLSVPKLMRRKGLWISYDKEGTLYTEYFKLSTLDAMIDSYWESDDNWETVPNLEFVRNEASKLPDGIITPEKLSPALQELIKQNNKITNLPDDEDLEERCGVIKFKDRAYNPYISSGKGYKILRKNWVNGYNTLTQDMINKENTIYEIRYDFDLKGTEITVPEGCILKFNGGSLDNGTLIGTETGITTEKEEIFGLNIKIQGNWNLNHISDRLFKFNTSTGFISNNIIKNIFALSNDNIHNTIHFEKGREYYIDNEYKGPANLGDKVRPLYGKLYTEEYAFIRIFDNIITSNTDLTIDCNLRMLPTNQGAYLLFYVENKNNISIDGKGGIYGDAETHLYTDPFVSKSTYYGEFAYCLKISSCNNVVIKNITLGYSFGDGLGIGSKIISVDSGTDPASPSTGKVDDPSKNVLVDNVKILYNRRNGISCAAHNVTIVNCLFEGNGIDEIKGTAPMCGIDFESDYIHVNNNCVNKNTVMSNCKFVNNKFDVSSTNNANSDSTDFGTIVHDCNFTSPLRLNTTYWLKFKNCYIPYLTNKLNSVDYFMASSNLVFENCEFGELFPYLEFLAKDENNRFINCRSKNSTTNIVKTTFAFRKGRYYKLSIPRGKLPQQFILKLTIFTDVKGNNQLVNEYKYFIGQSSENSLIDFKISYNKTATPSNYIIDRYVLTSIPYTNTETGTYDIYITRGSTLNDRDTDDLYNGSLYYEVQGTYKAEKSGETTQGIAISGGVYSQYSDFTKEIITKEDIPEYVRFLKEEVFNVVLNDTDLPTLDNKYCGEYKYVISSKKPVFWDSNSKIWRTADGYKVINRNISYAESLTISDKLSELDRGITFYIFNRDTYIYWDGNNLRNMDGSIYKKTLII